MNDVLAQVATNTETTRNAGNAILYECVKAIMTVESESGLKVLAVNILGRFLLNRDNNIRYVALNSLTNVVSEDIAAVQRHRATILDCLKDPDVSIRQRALELTYQLVNGSNIIELVKELLNYLVVAPPEHRALICSRVSTVAEKFAPSDKWQIETLITMLSIAGNHCDDSIACATVGYLTLSEALHGFATHKLFRLLRDELPRVQIALMHVAIWCIGEFGNHLIVPYNDSLTEGYTAIQIPEVLGLLQAVLKSHLATILTKSYVLTALMKLASRLDSGQIECQELVKQFITSLSLELQQRSCEYLSLLDGSWKEVLPHALARMPAADATILCSRQQQEEISSHSRFSSMDRVKKDQEPQGSAALASPPTDLLDLDELLGGTVETSREQSLAVDSHTDNVLPNDVDLLSDIFADASSHAPPLQMHSTELPASNVRTSSVPGERVARVPVYEKDGLSITMDLLKSQADITVTDIMCTFLNHTHKDFERFIFQAAVPRYVSMEMRPASGTKIPANNLGAITQAITVKNTIPSKPLMMRLKIQYAVGGRQIIEQAQVSSFPVL